MGEVWRARDTRLNREVALKVLPELFAGDPERMARFEREAQVLASLNHPHIAALYGLEESGGARALVMELVEGDNLQGPLAEAEAVGIARQIADALEYAHDRGIVHRDLKPANIKITPDGKVKVLDFGLAKALADDPVASSSQHSPTMSFAATRAGVILGTAAYMSPEQAKGKPADRRADIWAFGVVLCEMLTGRQVYGGETAAETIASVMRDDPAIPAATPSIQHLLRRCLQRDPRQRLQAIGEARILLEGGAVPAVAEAVASRAPKSNRWWMAATAALAVALLAVVALFQRRPAEEPARAVRFQIQPPEKALLLDGPGALSPDGRHLAFTAVQDGRAHLWIRSFDQLAARRIAGTVGAARPFWSPDGRFVGFFAMSRLLRVDISGGVPEAICDALAASTISGSWNRDGVIVFGTPAFGLARVPAVGGAVTPITTPGGFPSFLPDGRHLLYFNSALTNRQPGVYIAALGEKSLDHARMLTAADSNAVYVAGEAGGKGHLLFLRESTLMAQAFDAARLQVEGDPLPVADQVGATTRWGLFTASRAGVVAYTRSSDQIVQLAWFDRDGKREKVGLPGSFTEPRLSPDGKRLAVVVSDERSNSDLWVFDLARDVRTRLTFSPDAEANPVWSADGNHILYSITRKGIRQIYRKLASGAGSEGALIESDLNKVPWSVSPDGKRLVFGILRPGGLGGLYVAALDNPAKQEEFLVTPFQESFARYSPDGRWIAYCNNDPGPHQVFVQPYPPTGGKWQISAAGGLEPQWRRDGTEIYFRDANHIFAVPIQADRAAVTPGVPKALFEARMITAGANIGIYAASPDGRRFLIATQAQDSSETSITVVMNWLSGLKR